MCSSDWLKLAPMSITVRDPSWHLLTQAWYSFFSGRRSQNTLNASHTVSWQTGLDKRTHSTHYLLCKSQISVRTMFFYLLPVRYSTLLFLKGKNKMTCGWWRFFHTFLGGKKNSVRPPTWLRTTKRSFGVDVWRDLVLRLSWQPGSSDPCLGDRYFGSAAAFTSKLWPSEDPTCSSYLTGTTKGKFC